jgi:mono/diheme cytochrome c family protein
MPFSGRWLLAVVSLLFVCAGCRLDMHVQPRYNPYDPTDFFGDGQSARIPVEGTVPRGDLKLGPNELFYSGKSNDQPSEAFPYPATQQIVERGRERYNVFCSPCHGFSGDGDGMIVQRGFKRPPSLHEDRLRTAPVGHYFDVITNGFGVMYPYAYRIPVADRWAIISYVRALQLSRQVPIADVPDAERAKLTGQSK